MRVLRAHGLEASLPAGFGGRIFVRQQLGQEVPRPVAHFATVPLPAGIGDFGGGLVTLLGPTDVFVVLFEYGPESLGKKLFARQGMPRHLGMSDFRTYVLRRGVPAQSGTQWFFTEAGRPFTLYGVLGSHTRRALLLPKVNELLSTLVVQAPSNGAGDGPWN